jgi:hypothetical protein
VRILISVINFRHLTGAELYVYELSRCLASRGHEVSIVSQSGGLISQKARAHGVSVYDFTAMPAGLEFDLLHVQELAPAQWAMAAFPGTPAIATVHSQWPCEEPMIDERIHKYVCIRPEVRDKIVSQNGIALEKTAVVYNGVDTARFNGAGAVTPERPMVLFAGTVDPIRRASGMHLIERSIEEDFDVLFIGTRHDTQLDGELPPNVDWIQGDVWEIDEYVRRCTATAGIVLGRTTIEGWMCGKPGWIYDVDLDGSIKSVDLFPPPHRDLLGQFDIEFMTDQMELLYAETVGHDGPLAALRSRSVEVQLDLAPDAVAVAAFADELVADPALLAAWAAAPQGTLVIHATGDEEAAWAARLEEALVLAGVDPEPLDLLLVVADEPHHSLAAIGERVSGVLSARPPVLALRDLPHAGTADLAA